MDTQLNGITLQLIVGDLTELEVSAIVITVTPHLDMKTGLGQLVLQKGGTQIWDELDVLARPEVGQAVMTTGGTLPAKQVIYAVAPVIGGGGERGKLSSAIWNSLRLAENSQLDSIAFSAISTGRFGYPIEGCANVMAQKIVDFTFEDLINLKTIIVCLEDQTTYSLFEKAFQREVENAREDAEAGTAG